MMLPLNKPPASHYIILGRIGAPYGIHGYNHIQSYSEPPEQILKYANWIVRKNNNAPVKDYKAKGRVHAQGVVAQLEGVTDRDMARLLTGSDILVTRDSLPPLEPGEYYWTDLEGLKVETLSGVPLGTLAYLYLNAGHTNMLVKEGTKERHIPFVEPDFVKEISLASQKIIVDWDPEL